MTFADNRLLHGHFSCMRILLLQTHTIWPVASKSAQRPKGVGHSHAPLTSAPLLFRMNISSSRYVDLVQMWHEFRLCEVLVLCKRGGVFLGPQVTSKESVPACHRLAVQSGTKQLISLLITCVLVNLIYFVSSITSNRNGPWGSQKL